MVALLRNHPQFTAYVALVALCFFWGTTYLGIRIALESFGPLTIVCVRNLFSGALTLAAGRIAGLEPVRGRDVWITGLFGIAIIGVGNTTLSYAEQYIPSGLAALIVTTSPFWFVGAEALVPGGEPMRLSTFWAMLIGCAGVVLLVWPSGEDHSLAGHGLLIGFILLQISQASWSIFSIINRRRTTTAHPFMSGAVQQLASGLIFIVPAMLEDHSHASWNGLWAILYLGLFGGVFGYSCYSLVIARLPVAIGSVYTYVNPVVAVILGWIFYRERFGWKEAAGMAIIFSGVALVRRSSAPLQKPSPEPASESG